MNQKKRRSPSRKSLHLRIERKPPPPLQSFQKFLLNSFASLSPSAAALGCLIGFDLVVSKDQLPRAYASLRCVHLFRYRPHIRWVADDQDTSRTGEASPDTPGRQHVPIYDERAISVFTMHSVLRTSEWKTYDKASEELTSAMRAHQARYTVQSNLAELLASAHEYAAVVLASAVRAHVVGTFRMVALDPATVVRETTRKPLAAPEIDMDLEHAIAASESQIRRFTAPPRTGSSLAHSVHSHQQSLVKQVVRACNVGNHLNPTAARKAVTQELAAIYSLLGEDDHLPRLFLLVALDMVQQGNLAMSSIGRYFSGAATRLFAVLYPLNFAQLRAEKIVSGITTAIGGAEQSNKASVRIVGQLTLHILARHELIDEIRLSKTGTKRAVMAVRAQIIWPHEVDRALDWLDSQISEGPSEPILPAVRCAIGLAAETGMRIAETICLRVTALAFHNDRLQILIAPGRPDRTVKSKESKRLIEVTNVRVMNYVLDLLATRHSIAISKPDEDTVDQDSRWIPLNLSLKDCKAYLFGEPHNDNLIWEEVEVRKWISIVLKQSTGDIRSSAHDLRHTWTSIGNEKDFSSMQFVDSATYDRRANSLGHSASDLMFTTYTHMFGSGLRAMVDHQLAMDGVLEMGAAALWSVGLSSQREGRNPGGDDLLASAQRAYANLRASLSRRKFKVGTLHAQTYLLEYLRQLASKIDFDPINDVLNVPVHDGPPSFISFVFKGISINSILTALLMLSLDDRERPPSDKEIATQSGLTIAQTAHMRSEFSSICRVAKDVKPPPVLQANPDSWLVDNFWTQHLLSARSPKWHLLRSFLNKSSELEDLLLAADYVMRHMGVGSFLPAAPNDKGFASLIRIIKGSNLNTSALRLSSNCVDGDRHDSEYVQASLKKLLGVNVPILFLTFRSDRPPVYLSIRSETAMEKASKGQDVSKPNHDGRSYSMVGLSALFLAAMLKSNLLKGAQIA